MIARQCGTHTSSWHSGGWRRWGIKAGSLRQVDQYSQIPSRGGGRRGDFTCGMLAWGHRKTIWFEVKRQILFLAPAVTQEWPWSSDFSCHWTTGLYRDELRETNTDPKYFTLGAYQWSTSQQTREHHFPKSHLHTDPPMNQTIRKAPHSIWPLLFSAVLRTLKDQLFPMFLRLSFFFLSMSSYIPKASHQ